jgi:hypothetical protein
VGAPEELSAEDGARKGCVKNSGKDIRATGSRVSSAVSSATQRPLSPAAKLAGSVGGAASIDRSRATWFAPPYGGKPTSISHKMAPTLHRSALAS